MDDQKMEGQKMDDQKMEDQKMKGQKMEDQKPGTLFQKSASSLYQEQCDVWFKRETRSQSTREKAWDGQRDSLAPLPASGPSLLPLNQTQTSVTPKVESESAPEGKKDFETCTGCDPFKNEMITSRNYVKLLANNIWICNKHRLFCEAILDMKSHDGKKAFHSRPHFPATIDDNGPKFAVNEDRRLRRFVKLKGEDAWNEIAATGLFAVGRTANDLKERWFKLCMVDYFNYD